jgi:hypothetical protein
MAYPPYTKTDWVDDVTLVDEALMDKIEGGIKDTNDAVQDLDTRVAAAQAKAEKGQVNGYAALGADGLVPLTQLPEISGGGAELTYEGDFVPATTYQDGDVVVKDGVAYICVGGPTTEAPSIAPWGQAGLSVLGEELAYAEAAPANPLSIPVVAEASAVVVVTAPSVAVDGSTQLLIEFFCGYAVLGASGAMTFTLWDGSTEVGVIGVVYAQNPASGFPVRLVRRLTPSSGTHTYSVRAHAGTAAGNIYIGTGLGVGGWPTTSIRIARNLPSPPQFGAGALTPVTYGTTLPASPADGQEAILVDSLTAPTYQWRFRYNAARATNKWEFIGGAPASAYVATAEATSSTSYVALATPGPSITVPRAGIYDVRIGCDIQNVDQTGSLMSYDLGATVASDAWGIGAAPRNTSQYTSVTPMFRQRLMEVIPVAVA